MDTDWNQYVRQESNQAPAPNNPELALTQLQRAADTERKQSYLGIAVDKVTSAAFRFTGESEQKSRSHQELEGYLTGFAKAVPLFMRRFGMAGTIAAYALDEAKPSDSLQNQVVDLGLGGTKGLALRTTFNLLGQAEAPPAVKGMILGVTSRGVGSVLTRENYYNQDGHFDFVNGLENAGRQALNPTAMATDAATFALSEYTMGRLNYATKGALYKNPMLPNIVSGSVFGASTGMTSEILRESHDGHGYDPYAILRHGVLQGVFDGLAAAPGAYQGYRATVLRPGAVQGALPIAENEAAQARINSFNQLDSQQLELKTNPLDIENRLNDIAYLGRVSKDGFNQPVIFRLLNSETADRFTAESFAYKYNRAVGLSNGRLPIVEREATIDGAPVKGYVQALSGQSFEEAARTMSNRQFNETSDRSVARLLRQTPRLNSVLTDSWVERMAMNEWDNHSHNILMRFGAQNNIQTPNIDFALSLPEARYSTELIPSWGKTASRVSLLNSRLMGQLSGNSISGETRAGLSDFVATFNSNAGRGALADAGLSQAQMDGLLARSHWLANTGKLPQPEWRNPFTYGALWLLNKSGGGASLRFEQAQESQTEIAR